MTNVTRSMSELQAELVEAERVLDQGDTLAEAERQCSEMVRRLAGSRNVQWCAGYKRRPFAPCGCVAVILSDGTVSVWLTDSQNAMHIALGIVTADTTEYDVWLSRQRYAWRRAVELGLISLGE